MLRSFPIKHKFHLDHIIMKTSSDESCNTYRIPCDYRAIWEIKGNVMKGLKFRCYYGHENLIIHTCNCLTNTFFRSQIFTVPSLAEVTNNPSCALQSNAVTCVPNNRYVTSTMWCSFKILFSNDKYSCYC